MNGPTVEWGEESSHSTLFSEILHLREEVKRFKSGLTSGTALRTVSEYASCGVCTATPAGRILYANPLFSALHARSRQECIGEALALFIRPDQRAKLACLIEGAAAGDTYTAVPLWNLKGDGRAFPTLCSLFSLTGPEGTPACIVLLWMENAPFATVEEELRRCRTMLDRIGESLEVGCFTVDATGVVISWSSRAARISGWNQDASVASSVPFERIVHPDDKPRVQAWIQACVSREAPVELECRILRPDGRVRWIHGFASRQDALQNAPVAVQCVFQDVTETKQAREDLRQWVERHQRLIDTLPLPLQCVDDGGRIRDVNRCWLETLGYQREDVIGRPFTEFLDDDCRARFQEELAQSTAGQCGDVATFNLLAADKRVITVLYKLTPGFDEEGIPRYVTYQFIDVSRHLNWTGQAVPSPPWEAGPVPPTVLTAREMELCKLIRAGLSSKEIADRLSISTKSVQTHRNHIRRKLGLLNQAVNLAVYLKTIDQAEPPR